MEMIAHLIHVVLLCARIVATIYGSFQATADDYNYSTIYVIRW
jgi:hypothetical protein